MYYSQKYQVKRSAPAIIVKFTRRDTKEMFYHGRKELRGLTTKDFGFSDENNIFINESLTEANKELFKATLKVKKDYRYDYGRSVRKDGGFHRLYLVVEFFA